MGISAIISYLNPTIPLDNAILIKEKKQKFKSYIIMHQNSQVWTPNAFTAQTKTSSCFLNMYFSHPFPHLPHRSTGFA